MLSVCSNRRAAYNRERLMDAAAFAGLVLAVSIASERLVEVFKGQVTWLNEPRPTPKSEGRRKSTLQLLAVVAGIGTALLAEPVIAPSLPDGWDKAWALPLIGLLASGGSGLWNSILSYFVQIKDLKKAEVKDAHARADGGLPDLTLGEEQVTSNECYDVGEK
jgi:hypothetical protein